MNAKAVAAAGTATVAPDSATRRRALALLVVLTLAWGSTWPLLSTAVHEVSVWTFRTVSVILAGIAVLGTARLRGHSLRIERRHWPRICTATFFYFVLWNVASTYAAILLPSGQAAVIGFTMPLWSALLSWAVLGERLGARLVLGVALGATAVLLLMVPSFAAYAQAPAGLALGLVAAIGWAIGTLIIKRSDIVVSALVLTGWQLLISAVPTAIGAFVLGDGDWFVPSWQSIAAIAYIGLVPMAIGNVAWFAIVGILPVNVAGLAVVAVPVVAMLAGALVHGEPLGALQLTAMACSFAALWLVLMRPVAR
ncbi:MAG TPA: DMT family transporter [Burkholderiaceae bacterium]|jgi:drug/metabolite transporter (DMT)-like permease|nr:DMT family transporter [Burkholderiaceae bacterium]